MGTFEDRASSLVATAEKISRLKGLKKEADILRDCKARLVKTGYDNWDGGIDLYSLVLEVSVTLYAKIDEQQKTFEQNILEKINQLIRIETGHRVSEVIISPILIENAVIKSSNVEGEEAIPTFWEPGYFRLFISHLAIDKLAAHQLKEELAKYQIATFVAHDDIEPTKEWQGEIESALRTMDALLALISPEFVNSKWCDQEVGIAMGKSKLIIPLRYNADPHGFMGKYQGIQTIGQSVASIVEKIFDVLLKNELSSQRMTDALVERLVNSGSFESSKRNVFLLEKTGFINESHVVRLMKSIDENNQVGGSFGVPERIKNLISKKAKND